MDKKLYLVRSEVTVKWQGEEPMDEMEFRIVEATESSSACDMFRSYIKEEHMGASYVHFNRTCAHEVIR